MMVWKHIPGYGPPIRCNHPRCRKLAVITVVEHGRKTRLCPDHFHVRQHQS